MIKANGPLVVMLKDAQRNSSTGKKLVKKLFILVKEILSIFLPYLHLFPVSYYLEGT